MALMITDECINCGACEPECPNDAISEGEELFEINPELCTECVGYYDEPRCKDLCPVDEAIVQHPDYQESKEDLLKKKEALSKS